MFLPFWDAPPHKFKGIRVSDLFVWGSDPKKTNLRHFGIRDLVFRPAHGGSNPKRKLGLSDSEGPSILLGFDLRYLGVSNEGNEGVARHPQRENVAARW